MTAGCDTIQGNVQDRRAAGALRKCLLGKAGRYLRAFDDPA